MLQKSAIGLSEECPAQQNPEEAEIQHGHGYDMTRTAKYDNFEITGHNTNT